MARLVICAAYAVGIIVVLAKVGLTQSLGAHPFWADDVALYGAVPGVVLAIFLAWMTRWALGFAVLDLLIAGFVAWWGKRGFVASSGDDAFAGQLWFFGWIGVCACAVAVLFLTFLHLAWKNAE